MAATKVTFTLDADTIRRLNEAAETLSKPKSQVVREAIEEYHHRMGKLSEKERDRMVRVLDQVMKQIPARPRSEVEAELREIRDARRSGGGRTHLE
jgi:metal-responsive CopG/Arc/MetJ family transcriptional regulator